MLKKENELVLLLIGLCITWLGNFEAEANVQVEPNYRYPGFFQHAYSENRAKRKSYTNKTGQYIDEDQSDQLINDQPDEFINNEYNDQSIQNITDEHSKINKGHSGQYINYDQQDEFINDNQSTQNITDKHSQINEDHSGQNTNYGQQDEFINDNQSTQNITDKHSQINEDQSGQNTNDGQQDEFINDNQSTQNITDQHSQINEDQSGQNTNDGQQDEFINDNQSTQNITDQHSQINEDQSEQNTNDGQQDEFIDQSGQNTNDTQTYKSNHDQKLQFFKESLIEDDDDAELPDEDAELLDEGAYLPDEDFEFPKTVKQTYWNYYGKGKAPPPDRNDTDLRAAYGSKRVQIEIPPEFNSGSIAVTNKVNVALKWHVGIYTKTTTPYMQICGGTLVTLNYVISAAHCFWDEKRALPAEHFAVGAGKLYRPWFDAHETYSQTSDVSEIHIPSRYRGSSTNFQNDIALVKLSLSLTASPAVLPACVSFDESLDEEQLSKGTAGTVMGWGLTQQDGDPSQVLNYVELPPLSVDECFEQSGSDFFKYITSDKICAGVTGQGLCTGDSGGGLVFLDGSSSPVPYLRGVVSTAPRNEHACNTATFSTFTHVFHHRVFLLKHLPLLERDCQRRYKAAIVEDKKSCQRSKQTIYSPYSGTTVNCECYTI